MKRTMDIVLSMIAIIVFIIPMSIIAILIKLDSEGPIIYKQQRPSKEKKLFNIYKFRTMRTDTPNVSTEELGDPSQFITKLGKFLRKSSLDELPQLFNILLGDMSIVGPRPALYNQYELIKMRDELGVNSIRPGLTGFAQVRGRDFISDKEKVKYDKYYLDNMSIWLDLKIILWTIRSVVKSEGVRVG
ncbi:sugar transferase [Psychrobacillus vulpis]|uniref:Sugar transferase n=1 Tax=Psychrobacillus vulpis TaxID=2325572 RepID=A0A544TUW1_9BACI|nr:sugar transferase [Psychrobacillus vulpis]TQR21233.1 sugar transferase [Psychrobacillus vulpis]